LLPKGPVDPKSQSGFNVSWNSSEAGLRLGRAEC
jgi:hypothetical protein